MFKLLIAVAAVVIGLAWFSECADSAYSECLDKGNSENVCAYVKN